MPRLPELPRSIVHLAEELRELGVKGTAFRLGWEAAQRSGAQTLERRPRVPKRLALRLDRVPFEAPEHVAAAVDPLLDEPRRHALRTVAAAARTGTIRCFSRWDADFGNPIDWFRDPTTGHEWPRRSHFSRVLRTAPPGVDVKIVWEAARFPHAYWLGRSGALSPDDRPANGHCLAEQIRQFDRANPWSFGPHWASSQELAFRLLAWLFGVKTLALAGRGSPLGALVARALFEAAHHTERHLAYARHAVHNNHLLSEALLLLVAGRSLDGAVETRRWLELGEAILGEQADEQFYPDGAYIQLSHNYHRLALQVLLLAGAFAERAGGSPDPRVVAAIDRSVAFLHAHQNPVDGSLPNYGTNDGGLPALLSTCDFCDFRPTLQAAALVSRGERLYPPGPWDEEAAWLVGVDRLQAPLRPRAQGSVSFSCSGFHVLRGRDPRSFATFRCGTIRDRFTQMDMLNVDLFWRGLNVVGDGGSYSYNGPQQWHVHFQGTRAHNTVTVDGLEQMVQHRRFKLLYPTQATTLRFATHETELGVVGEHQAFARQLPGCIHRRALATDGQDLWGVIDDIFGTGRHRVRLHWLLGPYPWVHDGARSTLRTPAGEFSVLAHLGEGTVLPSTLVTGDEAEPRGWLSRYYGEKTPTPSFAAELDVDLPVRLVTVLGTGQPRLERRANELVIVGDGIRLPLADSLVGAPIRRPLP